MKVIEIGNKNYPQKLLNIYNPPKKIYLIGNERILNDFSIAIVGTRNCSKYGEKIAKSMAYNLSKHSVNVVSGLAKGIDSFAHLGTIIGRGKTIAVLGGGFNYIYPRENTSLFKSIIETGGAVISEYDENVKPVPENFPKRNRIISGISNGVVVVEAGQKSGSLITADFAVDEGKDVFAVPGSIYSNTSRGTNELIKEGAKLVENVFDILEEYPYFNNIKK